MPASEASAPTAVDEVAAWTRTSSPVRSSTRALTILQIVALHGDGPLSLADLARHSGLPKPTVYRLAGVLCDSVVLQRDEDGGDLPGAMLLVLGSSYLSKMRLRDASRAARVRLHRFTSQSVYLGVPQNPWVVNVARVESSDQARVIDAVGSLSPQHTTAAGKVLLAFGDSEVLDFALRARLRTRTAHSITDSKELVRELRNVVNRGFATEIEENDVGVVSVAAPIFSRTERAIGAIGMSAPERVVPPLLLSPSGAEVQAAAHKVSMDLG